MCDSSSLLTDINNSTEDLKDSPSRLLPDQETASSSTTFVKVTSDSVNERNTLSVNFAPLDNCSPVLLTPSGTCNDLKNIVDGISGSNSKLELLSGKASKLASVESKTSEVLNSTYSQHDAGPKSDINKNNSVSLLNLQDTICKDNFKELIDLTESNEAAPPNSAIVALSDAKPQVHACSNALSGGVVSSRLPECESSNRDLGVTDNVCRGVSPERGAVRGSAPVAAAADDDDCLRCTEELSDALSNTDEDSPKKIRDLKFEEFLSLERSKVAQLHGTKLKFKLNEFNVLEMVDSQNEVNDGETRKLISYSKSESIRNLIPSLTEIKKLAEESDDSGLLTKLNISTKMGHDKLVTSHDASGDVLQPVNGDDVQDVVLDVVCIADEEEERVCVCETCGAYGLEDDFMRDSRYCSPTCARQVSSRPALEVSPRLVSNRSVIYLLLVVSQMNKNWIMIILCSSTGLRCQTAGIVVDASVW